MAIKGNNEPDNGSFTPPNPGGNIPQTPMGNNPSWGFFNMRPTSGMSRTAASEVLVKAMAVLTAQYLKDFKDSPMEVIVLAVDNTKETRLSLSSVVVCARNKANPGAGVSYHTVILEGSGESLADEVVTYNNRQIVISRFAADVMTSVYRDTVATIVQRAFPGKSCFAVSGQVIPRSFNWEDENAARLVAANASLPVLSDQEMRDSNWQDFDLSQRAIDANLQVRVDFNQPDKVDYVGLPVRSNISVDLIATEIVKPDAQGIKSQARTMKVTSVGGYIDLVWAPVTQPQGYGYGYDNQSQPMNQKFAARLVVTNLENYLRPSIPAQLLALATTIALTEGKAWYPYYSPRPKEASKGAAVDLKDIGAINVEANIFNDPSGYGGAVDTKAASFNVNKLSLGTLLQGAVRPGLTISLLVSDLGADTWYNEVFSLAAQGNPRAAQALLEGANTLTGGKFAQFYGGNDNPVMVMDEQVHLGYYIGADGQRHDIRDYDYLAMLNLGASQSTEIQRQTAQAFSDTFYRTEYPLAQRLSERKRMLSELIRYETTWTGMARLVTLDDKFVIALGNACKAAGLNARLVSPALSGGYEDQRGVASFLPQTAVMPGSFKDPVFGPNYGGGESKSLEQTRQFGGRWSI
jgi:hypothetical protein